MSIKPVTVTQLNTYIKQIFDAEELLHNISVFGEVSGYTNVRGTAYFTLKDENSALSCVCFTADMFSVKNGDSIMVVGSPRFYSKAGKLNFNVIRIEPYGENLLFQKFLQLKQKLFEKGYFEDSHKIKMPDKIKRIGVVSSEGGAVIQDIINVGTRRNPNIDIVLYPVKVQGNGAELEIAKGIKFLDNYNVDIIIVARGGGSMEDLEPFNTEIVADATYNCKKFIVSAVGHETDYTIIDFCSDLRAPTPSVAAELCFDNVLEIKSKCKNMFFKLVNEIQRKIKDEQRLIQTNVRSLYKEFLYFCQNSENEFNKTLIMLTNKIDQYLPQKQYELKHNIELLKKLNPESVLRLGYSVVKSNLKHISSVKDVAINDNIEIKLKDGIISAVVEGVE